MKIRLKSNPLEPGESTRFNIHGLFEVIVYFAEWTDTCYIRDLEVYLVKSDTWKCMKQAFRDGDIIPNNENTSFKEPNDLEKQKGYYE